MSYTPNKLSTVSAIGINSDTAISGGNWSGNTYTGAGEENDYAYVGVNLQVDESGTLFFDFSQDGTNWSTYPVNGFDVASGINEVHTAWKGGRYMRPRFVGSGGRTFFRLKTYYSNLPLPLTAPLNQTIGDDQDATVVRSVLIGSDEAGNYRNVGTDAEGHLKVHLDEPLTAFGELRMAEMTPLIQILHPYELNLDLVSTGNTTGSGSVTYDTGTTMVSINSGAATSSSGVMNTRRLVKYRNGQGLLVRYTAIFDTAVSGNEQWVGWGDDLDGFFFGYSGTTFGILRRNSNSGDEFTPQTNWNIDKMDGSSNSTNPSAQLLDPTTGNVFQIQAQWLGFGAINCFIESSETGQFEPVHQIKYANSNLVPSVINPTFPLWIESTNTTNSTDVTIQNASMAAFNEGVVRYTGPTKSFGNGKASTTNTVQFSLQNPTTYKGKRNRSRIKLESLNIYSDQANADPVQFRLVLDPTLASTSFASFGNYTAIEIDTAGTYTSGGDDIFESGTSEVDSKVIDLTPYDIFLNPGEIISVISDGNNTGAGASLTWVEDL